MTVRMHGEVDSQLPRVNTSWVVSLSIPGDGSPELHWYRCSECGARVQAAVPPRHCGLEMERDDG